ncbi:Hypothetical protein SCF082_LOCUS5370, partial [Durusdinium trenchii]
MPKRKAGDPEEALESAKKKDKKDKKEKEEKKEKKEKKDKKDKRAAAAASAFLEEAPPTPVAILQPSPYRIAEGEDGKEEEIAAPEKKDTKKETKSESKKGKGNKPKSAKEPSKGGQKIEQKGQKAPDIEKEGSLDQDMVESKAQEDEQHKAHTIQAAEDAEDEDFWKGLNDEGEQPISSLGSSGKADGAVFVTKEPDGDADPSLKQQEAEEARTETDPGPERVLQLSREEQQTLMTSGQLHLQLLNRCCEAKVKIQGEQLHFTAEQPYMARTAELAARCLLASNRDEPVELRVVPEASGAGVVNLPGAGLLQVPSTGGVDPKELRRFGDVVAAFVLPKEPLKKPQQLSAIQEDLSRQLGLAIDQAVEVRYGEDWFHATVVGFTDHGTVMADYFRKDESRPEFKGGEIEVAAADIRAAQTPRPGMEIHGTLLLIGDKKARECARQHAAAQAERKAIAEGVASSLRDRNEQTMTEQLLGMPEDGEVLEEESDCTICVVELPADSATGSGLQRLNQAAQVTDAALEVLPGGR